MAEMNIWLERFSRDIGYKSSVIVFGNTSDIMLNPKNFGRYDKVINTLIAYVRDKGYKQIIKWDRVDGIDHSVSDEIMNANPDNTTTMQSNDLNYDLDEESDTSSVLQQGNCYKNPDE